MHDHVELLTAFSSLGTEYYKFAVPKINFNDNVGSAKQINDWVSDKTNNKIHDIITSGILINSKINFNFTEGKKKH